MSRAEEIQSVRRVSRRRSRLRRGKRQRHDLKHPVRSHLTLRDHDAILREQSRAALARRQINSHRPRQILHVKPFVLQLTQTSHDKLRLLAHP